MLKQVFIKHFAKICVGVAILFFVIAGIVYAHTTTPQIKKITTQIITHTVTPTPTISLQQGQGEQVISIPTVTTTVDIQMQSPTATPVPQQQQSQQVNLSINGSSVGQISIASGANQCDVLQNALSQGKIQSLNMRYDNSLGTYGVYQINGQGKENAIWWTYKVNGQSPSQGCSYIKANNNDNVDWSYVGS